MRYIVALSLACISTGVFAQNSSDTRTSTTVPYTNGYVYAKGPPPGPEHKPPPSGGVVGVQYPPAQPPTTVKCHRDGKEVPC